MHLTAEQEAIINSPLRGVLKVRAYAGTGKTSTLVAKASRESVETGARGVYLAFNKAAQLDAQARFGSSAICKTTHAVAYPRFGARYRDNTRSMRPLDVIQFTGLVDDYTDARILLDTVTGYCTEPQVEFPSKVKLPQGYQSTPFHKAVLASKAKQLWEMMCDPAHPAPMSHDGYLKLYQLSNPRIPGDYLMVDEFQDTNPVVLDIVSKQTQPVIVVGDPYQSIYAFRGAVNAMQQFKAHRQLSLTTSWRFGPAVADIANALLHGFHHETERVVGMGYNTEIDVTPPSEAQLHTITRTNAELFDQAASALQSGRSIGFVGGVKSYNLQRVCDVRNIQVGRIDQVQDAFLKHFKSGFELLAYAEDVEDAELLRLDRVCQERGDRVFELVDDMHRLSVDAKDASRVFVTAHKSKGLTLDHVVLAEDFKPILEASGAKPNDMLDPQEVNLTYVAATRAVKTLQTNQHLRSYLSWYEGSGK